MASIEDWAEQNRDAILAEVMDPGRSKPLHEHVAANEIGRLRAENERLVDALKVYLATAAATRPQPN